MWLRWVLSNLLSEVAEKKVRDVVDTVRKSSPAHTSAPAIEAPKCDIVVASALNLESRAFVGQLQEVVTTRCAAFVEHVGKLGQQAVLVAETGTGDTAVRKATEDIIALHAPKWIIAAGFAGALTPAPRRGHIVMPDQLVDATNHRLRVPLQFEAEVLSTHKALHVGTLLNVDHVLLDTDAKRRRAKSYDAIACDMESMATAQVCRQHNVRFLAVRVVSDTLDDHLPKEIEHLIGQRTVAAKFGAATRALLNRPGSVKDLWQLRDVAGRCATNLAQFLAGVIPQLDA